MTIEEQIAELARECNDLTAKVADAAYKKVMNVLFQETGEYYLIDLNVVEDYKRARAELNSKIDELDLLVAERDKNEQGVGEPFIP